MFFDLIVIGSGPAGQKAALQGVKAGKKVALIEAAEELGGGCVHQGTLPSKSFRESVYRWSLGSKGALGGARGNKKHPEPVEVTRPDMFRLLQRRDRVVKNECKIIHDQLHRNGVTIYRGYGKLCSPHEVEVESSQGKEKLTASFVILAVGARPVAPSHLRVDGQVVLDSDSILNLKKIPEKLVVLGAGIIGCEFASMFAMAGSKVYLVDRRNEILASVDREIAHYLVEHYKSQGVEILLETEATQVEASGRVTLSSGRQIDADAVLVALGRLGNTQNLGLEKVGIQPDGRGLIPVDKNFNTSVPNIYAVGDVVGAPALASTSMEQGIIAAAHAFGIAQSQDENPLQQQFPYGIYTIPEVSMVGATEEELKVQKIDYAVGRAYYRELARGQIVGDDWGLLKLVVDVKNYKLLGVHIVGDNAADLIHIGQAVMSLGGDIHYFTRSVFNYPTLAEAYKTAAFRAMNHIKNRKN